MAMNVRFVCEATQTVVEKALYVGHFRPWMACCSLVNTTVITLVVMLLKSNCIGMKLML